MKKSGIRRCAALAFLLALLLQTAAPAPARAAASGIYFVAANDDLLELTQETMPFWSGGQLYVSNAVFSGIYGRSLGVSCSPGVDTAVLYTLQNALFFDTSTNTTYDSRGNLYSQHAIRRGSYVFFPISLFTSFFGLTYSYLSTDYGPLIRIKSNAVVIADDDFFVDAASGSLQSRYNAYIRSQTPSQPTGPEDPADEETPTVYGGKRVYLIFSVTDRESTLTLLDTLADYGAQATFLLSEEEMAEDHDLLRRLVGAGHAVAVDCGGDPAGELELANEVLWEAAHTRTRLAWAAERSEESVSAAGCCTVGYQLDYSRQSLTSSSRAQNLYTHLSGLSRTDVAVYLGDDGDNTAGLGRLLSLLEGLECRVLAYRETLSLQ